MSMFDHITLRVADLAAASSAFKAVLDELGIEQTASTPSFSAWGNSRSRGPTRSVRSRDACMSRSSPRPRFASSASARGASTPALLMTGPPGVDRTTPMTCEAVGGAVFEKRR
jgi:hypothetical protein